MCKGDESLCLGLCIPTGKDTSNCGGCGITCLMGQKCSGGQCTTD
jgi:hypothetical protein